ncbi:MAG: alpha/beta hydrolase family protein, partial [Sphingopyxis sp.]
GYSDEQKCQLARDGRVYEDNPYGPEPTLTTHALWQSGQRNLLLGGPIALPCPVQLIHGMADGDVPFAISINLAQQLCSAQVVTHLIKDGDHRLSRPQDIALLLRLVAQMTSQMETSLA